ncbi:MAG: Uma2 family endonuclease [Candidatus Rokubacteria bacterium]|nr:Uma2 family endonuclease [Candidatus Rokubacteria bacterium]
MIEGADSSLRYDRTTKPRIYAEAAVPEYWIVDCVTESVEIYRTPRESACHDFIRIVVGDATVAPQAFPDVVLTLADIFA